MPATVDQDGDNHHHPHHRNENGNGKEEEEEVKEEEIKILLILAGGTICMQSSIEGYKPTHGQLLSTCLQNHPSFDDGSHPTPAKIVDERGIERLGDVGLRLPAKLPVGDDGVGRDAQPSPSSPLPPAPPPPPPPSGRKAGGEGGGRGRRRGRGKGRKRITYTSFEFTHLIDSSSATSTYWLLIASVICQNYADFDAFVVLHGTDTLAYAASALSFLLHPLRKPVVLTGSQVSIFDRPSDAWDNVLGSLEVAGEGAVSKRGRDMEEEDGKEEDGKEENGQGGALLQEVAIFFHRVLYRGNRCVKIHASEYAAFATPNLDPLAWVQEGGKMEIEWNWELLRQTTHDDQGKKGEKQRQLDPLVQMDSSTVAVLRIYPGFNPILLSSLLSNSKNSSNSSTSTIKGLVLETFGAGNIPTTTIPGGGPDLITILRTAIQESGVVVVNVSQCLNGTVTPFYAPAKKLEDAGVVSGGDMTTEAAFVKLVYLLGGYSHARDGDEKGEEVDVDVDVGEVRRLMRRSLRGELTEEGERRRRKVGGGGKTEEEEEVEKKRRSSLVVRRLEWTNYVPSVTSDGTGDAVVEEEEQHEGIRR